MNTKSPVYFILLGLLALLGGAFFGCLGAIQFVYADFLKILPFYKLRPLHVSLVISWIFLASIGSIYYYLPQFTSGFRKKFLLQKIHLLLFIVTGLCILSCYFLGIFGGREYWEYPPVFSILILITWIIFMIIFFFSIKKYTGTWPVYMWMWATGIVFFLFTFVESHLWLIPEVRNNPLRDVTVQWKAYGALIGSWNMLVYGTGIFVMGKISGDVNFIKSKSVFLLYFLGLTNLLFGWAHHIYEVPVDPWIRNISYAISMSEWILLFRIIYNWRKTVNIAGKHFWKLPYRYILASDIWVFLNIILALLISIPAINIYTHGTHITVAHAMGSTIGINTMILFASCQFIASNSLVMLPPVDTRRIETAGWLITNISLLIFWLMLIGAGIRKGTLIANGAVFNGVTEGIRPYMIGFAYSGIALFIGICMISIPLIYRLYFSIVSAR